MRFKDWWKKLKGWQKGFLIGAFMHLLYFLFFIPTILRGVGETRMAWIFVLTELVLFTFIFPFMESLADSLLGIFTIGLILTAVFGLGGALIGFFIDRYKPHKK